MNLFYIPNYSVVPVDFETFGSLGMHASIGLGWLGQKQSEVTGERRSMRFLRSAFLWKINGEMRHVRRSPCLSTEFQIFFFLLFLFGERCSYIYAVKTNKYRTPDVYPVVMWDGPSRIENSVQC